MDLLGELNGGARTVVEMARALGITEADAARRLSAATAQGLVAWEDENRCYVDGRGSEFRFARLSTEGLGQLHRLLDHAAGPTPAISPRP